ncbi:MAG: ABC transporter permease [Opitutaceae bacterium]
MKFRALFHRKKLDAEMAEEMRQHLELRTQANLAAGMSPDEARYAAQRSFGGVDQIKEIAREDRGWIRLEELIRDLKFSARQLAKSPGFTAVAVLTLALALGVNSAVFALVDAVVLRPAVSLRPEELVTLFNGRQGAARDFRHFSHAEYLALREAKDTFADVAASVMTSAGLDSSDGVRKVQAFLTSENYFALLGATQPAIGRFYTAEECRPNATSPVIVTSHALWQRQGGRSDFVGSVLRVNGKTYTVIGVAPEHFNGVLVFGRTELWVPLGMLGEFSAGSRTDLSSPRTYRLIMTARLAPGVTRGSLPARLPALAQSLTAIQAEAGEGARELQAEPPSRSSISTQPSGGDSAVPLAIGVFSMSICVLLIGCLNLANMLLARGAHRAKEIALRLALGADRWRIVRQLVAEGLVLACAGGAVGLIVGMWGNEFLLQSLRTLFANAGETLVLEVRPDARVLGATFLLCLGATLFFSLGPALKASRTDLVHHLKQQGGEPTGTGRAHRFFSLSHCLVMGQIALSLALLFSAGLFFRGALQVGKVHPGFDPAGALVADLDYALADLTRGDSAQSLLSAIERLAGQPGVQAVAAATFVPYSTRSEGGGVRPEGVTDPARSFSVTHAAITSAYFDATGIRLVRGRDFTAAETRDPAAPVAIVDEALGRKLFPTGELIGQRIQIGSMVREIVGLCAPHRQSNRRPNVPYRVFSPYASGHDGRAFLVVHPAAGSTLSVASLRTMLRTLDPKLPVVNVATFASLIEKDFTVWLARLGATLFGLFGAIALVLAVVGVYGVKAYAVARRTREIGIRMAIGAQPRDVFALLLKQGALQILVATLAGSLLALGAGKILAKMLYQVSPSDPVALGTSIFLLSAAALLASFIPARRATKVDPLIALRAE